MNKVEHILEVLSLNLSQLARITKQPRERVYYDLKGVTTSDKYDNLYELSLEIVEHYPTVKPILTSVLIEDGTLLNHLCRGNCDNDTLMEYIHFAMKRIPEKKPLGMSHLEQVKANLNTRDIK